MDTLLDPPHIRQNVQLHETGTCRFLIWLLYLREIEGKKKFKHPSVSVERLAVGPAW